MHKMRKKEIKRSLIKTVKAEKRGQCTPMPMPMPITDLVLVAVVVVDAGHERRACKRLLTPCKFAWPGLNASMEILGALAS